MSIGPRARHFFDLLLDIESNIPSADPRWHGASNDEHIDYWRVHQPGTIMRSWDSGEPVAERIGVGEFMRRTGVDDLYARRDVVGLRSAQYAVMNPWGFVGYQFGEPLLIDLQYYSPLQQSVTLDDGTTSSLPSYYSSALPVSTWRHGETEHVYYDDLARTLRVGTDVNRWLGTFTGKDSIGSLDDLRTASGQEAVLRSSLRRNASILDRHLAKSGDALWSVRHDRPPAASLLAASHLCGPFSVTSYLKSRVAHEDEAGTTIQTYIDHFSDAALAPQDLGLGQGGA